MTLAKLRYDYPLDQLPTASTAGAAFWTNFDASVLEGFDGTHLPVGYNQWFNNYRCYQVMGCSIRCTFFNRDPTNNIIVIVLPYDNAQALPTVGSLACDALYSKWKVLGPQTGQSVKTIKHYMTGKKIFGYNVNDISTQGVIMAATPGGAPAQLPNYHWRFAIGQIALVSQSASSAPNVSISIKWYVKFYDRKLQSN